MSNTNKKLFVEPKLFVHGHVEEITKQNNQINVVDVPQGTIGPDDGTDTGIQGS